MTTRGICQLCRLEKDLQDSHFYRKGRLQEADGAVHQESATDCDSPSSSYSLE